MKLDEITDVVILKAKDQDHMSKRERLLKEGYKDVGGDNYFESDSGEYTHFMVRSDMKLTEEKVRSIKKSKGSIKKSKVKLIY